MAAIDHTKNETNDNAHSYDLCQKFSYSRARQHSLLPIIAPILTMPVLAETLSVAYRGVTHICPSWTDRPVHAALERAY